MGNVMGNVEWLSKDIRSEGRFSIGSTGHKNMYIGLGLNGLKLEAKAGIVGGSIDLGRINAYCHLREDSQTDPFHEVRNFSLLSFLSGDDIWRMTSLLVTTAYRWISNPCSSA